MWSPYRYWQVGKWKNEPESRTREQPSFSRWLGYLNVWAALSFCGAATGRHLTGMLNAALLPVGRKALRNQGGHYGHQVLCRGRSRLICFDAVPGFGDCDGQDAACQNVGVDAVGGPGPLNVSDDIGELRGEPVQESRERIAALVAERRGDALGAAGVHAQRRGVGCQQFNQPLDDVQKVCGGVVR
jgi:hypothetical protein